MTDDAGALQLVKRHAAGIPHNRALGIWIAKTAPREAWFDLPYDPKLIGNPDTGVLHGGAITALLDGCSGAAVFCAMETFVPIATLDFRVDYIRPAEPGKKIHAHATCYKMTRNVAFTRAVAYHDDEANPIAHSVATFMVGTKLGALAMLSRSEGPPV